MLPSRKRRLSTWSGIPSSPGSGKPFWSERIDHGTAAIRFLPDGSSTGGRVELWLGPLHRAIDIDWLTGMTHVVDLPAS